VQDELAAGTAPKIHVAHEDAAPTSNEFCLDDLPRRGGIGVLLKDVFQPAAPALVTPEKPKKKMVKLVSKADVVEEKQVGPTNR